MSSKFLKQFNFKTMKVIDTKGFKRSTFEVFKDGEQPITLAEVKKLNEEFAKASGDAKYTIRGRNIYASNHTLKGMNDDWYDQDDNYYNSRGYEKEKFDSFQRIQLYVTKNK